MDQVVNAIVLAGNRGASNEFSAVNKLSLEINGKPLLIYVLQALQAVKRVQRVVIVGPSTLIHNIIELYSQVLNRALQIDVVEQRESAYDNFWAAFTNVLPGYFEGLEDHDESLRNQLVLVVPCDTPLMTSKELDEFLDASDTEALDYCVGMTEQQYLQRFMATETLPGIRTNYLHLANGSFRLNNLHLLRPFAVLNRRFIQRIFEIRYQMRVINILRVGLELVRIKGLGFRALKVYSLLQLSAITARLALSGWTAFFQKRVTMEDVAQLACKMLDSRVGIIETTRGGCAIDVDNATDFATIKLRFDEFYDSSNR